MQLYGSVVHFAAELFSAEVTICKHFVLFYNCKYMLFGLLLECCCVFDFLFVSL